MTPPPILRQVTIGLNTTIRRLEEMSDRSRPPILQNAIASIVESDIQHSKLSMVYVSYSTLPSALISALPMLIAAASLANPQQQPIRLVPVSGKCEAWIAQAVDLPKVGILGLDEDIRGAMPLVELINQNIDPIKISWLENGPQATSWPLRNWKGSHYEGGRFVLY